MTSVLSALSCFSPILGPAPSPLPAPLVSPSPADISSPSPPKSPPSLPSSSSSSSSLGVRLLPPLLSDQAVGIHAQEAFLLFCLALGPSDLHIHWQVNGQRLEAPVKEYRHSVTQWEVFLSSWLRQEVLEKDSEFQCTATSHVGNETTKTVISLSSRDEDSAPANALSQWKSALSHHEKLLQSWKKAWESCSEDGVL